MSIHRTSYVYSRAFPVVFGPWRIWTEHECSMSRETFKSHTFSMFRKFRGIDIAHWVMLTLDYSVVLPRRYILCHIRNLLGSPNPWLENRSVRAWSASVRRSCDGCPRPHPPTRIQPHVREHALRFPTSYDAGFHYFDCSRRKPPAARPLPRSK